MPPARIECFVEDYPKDFPSPGKHYAYAVCDYSGCPNTSRHLIKTFDEYVDSLISIKNIYFSRDQFVPIYNNVPHSLKHKYAHKLSISELEEVIERVETESLKK